MGISESIERLREYIENDIIYQDYKKRNKEPSDFERFCFVHCRDIENVLNENQQLKERHYLIQGGRGNCKTLVLMLQKENDKYKSILDEIREYVDNLPFKDLIPIEVKVIKKILDKVKE